MNEVYEGNLELLVQRADELFCLMPNHNTTVELIEHSPLRAKKTTPTVNPANYHDKKVRNSASLVKRARLF
jgi:hypothetical protein